MNLSVQRGKFRYMLTPAIMLSFNSFKYSQKIHFSFFIPESTRAKVNPAGLNSCDLG